MTFATSTGMLTNGMTTVTNSPYARAGDCKGANSKTGMADIDLGGTPFVLPTANRYQAPNGTETPLATDGWCTRGFNSAGSVTLSPDMKKATLTGGGFCGNTTPKSVGASMCDGKLILVYAP